MPLSFHLIFLLLANFGLNLCRTDPDPLLGIVRQCMDDRNTYCPQSTLGSAQKGVECMEKHLDQFSQQCRMMILTLHNMVAKQDRFVGDEADAKEATWRMLENEFFMEGRRIAEEKAKKSEL